MGFRNLMTNNLAKAKREMLFVPPAKAGGNSIAIFC